ncbi:site-specific integrase [Rhodoferax sp.]|uniref:site-specific integrase n=1 Tax=Rhodoferax sp. TaxID=50421 RepID=UPI002843E391|nr:site-specific integrase [Rhodoferax sp.]MDR3368924.1 site-specific integrase [Rhodoferax sp.]
MKTSTRLVTDFAVWLDQHGIEGHSLSAKHIADYLDDRWLQRRRRRGDAFTLDAFARIVAPDEYGVRPEQRVVISPALRVRQEFEQYLLRERGLAAASIRLYGESVGRFLDGAFGSAEVRLDQLTAPDVIGFVQTEAARLRHPKRAQVMTTALRSFLQYGRYCGEIVADLHTCVPTVANWSLAGIPRTISPGQVQSLLGGCDRQSASGRRDYAMLVLISRLGLRASEVVDLTLDDIDWTEGAIRIRGPAQRADRLPLPADVGAALVDYLRHGRPDCTSRNVFIRSRAPLRALFGPSAVSCIVFRALRRAGIDSPTKGAHLLRHSLATQMLGGGASLGEIAEILRHRNPQTTTIYAKVDLVSLHTLALPWLGGVQ